MGREPKDSRLKNAVLTGFPAVDRETAPALGELG